MRCIYCNAQLASIPYCPQCGADVTLLKRIGRISNLLYNRGLEKASVRDLSGAIGCLQQSLKFYKENTDARNLLGLCYYETGEVVSALCEWVISKNMRPAGNQAEEYINLLQNNKNQLDVINQSIRKYNQSIEYCREGHEDMAVMQLKKVISQNPKLVKAQQLLALLYMKNQEYEKARKVLRRAAAVDNTNTTTLRYLSEIEEVTGRSSSFGPRHRRGEQLRGGAETDGATLHYTSGTQTIIQPTTFRDSSTVATFINIGLGVLLGGAVIWFMAVPATQQRAQEKANQAVTDANLKLASGTAQVQDLQDEISGYQAQVEAANADKEEALAKAKSYDELLAAANLYVSGEQTAAVDAIGRIDENALDGNAKTLYTSILTGVSTAMFSQYYTEGTTAYARGDYTTAAQQLKAAVESDPDGKEANYYNALYYLGFAYFNLKDSVNADKYFEELIRKYPNQEGAISPYLSKNQTWTGTSSTSTVDTASQGEAAASQGQTQQDQSQQYQDQSSWNSGGDITIYGDTGQTTQQSYNWSDVAWTDPYTGLHYDAYGNLLG